MEENENEVVIDIKINQDEVAARLGEVNAEILKLKVNNNDLKKSIAEGNDEFGKNSRQLAENQAKLYALNREQQSLTGRIEEATKENRTYGTSLKEQAGLLKEMKERYYALTKEERENSEIGGKLLNDIQALDKEIKAQDASIGNYQRNVGNYASALQNWGGNMAATFAGMQNPLAMAKAGVQGLGTAFKALIANPVGAAIAAIVAVLKLLKASFNGNEEATMGLKEALSALNPVIDTGKRALDAMAKVITKVVRGAVDGLTAAIGGLMSAVQWIGNVFGADWHMADNFNAGVAGARSLQEAENEYIKHKREWSVESAKIDRDVADLREKAAQKDKYNAKERLSFLDQAIALETKKAEREKELAQENLRLLQQEAERSANSAAMNDRLAEAERAVIEADTRLSDIKRSLSKQRQSAVTEINGVTKALQREKEVLIGLLPALEQWKNQEGWKPSADTMNAIESLRISLSAVGEEVEKLSTSLEGLDIDFENNLPKPSYFEQFTASFLEYSQVVGGVTGSLEKSFGNISSLYKMVADDESKTMQEREEAALKARRWSMLQVSANSAVALATSISEASKNPWPANIAAIASSVATVLGFIAQAKAMLNVSQGFEHGGIIGGTSYTGDKVPVRGNSLEMVLTRSQQKTLFDIANGNVGGANLTQSLVTALRSMPAPTLVYSEFADFQGKVINLNNSQRIK